MTEVESYLERHRDRHLSELFDFLRIPSISTDAERTGDVRRCAEFLRDELARIGFEAELMETGGHPIVLAHWHGAPGAPTALYYGHYDVQPVDPLELWESPPFEPTIKNGAIIARGACDDKGQVFAHVKALEAVMAVKGKLPVNVTVLIEGEEECGSVHLEPFLAAQRERLKSDVVLVSDTGMFAPGIPSIVYGLRGLCYAEIHVHGPKRDLHSGTFGGTVTNPLTALGHVLAQIWGQDGRVRIPGFYDDVAELDAEERTALRSLPFDEAAFLAEAGAPAHGEPGYNTLERHSVRPTFDVNGMWGGFIGKGAKTVLPAEAHAKVSMRLVPNMRPDDIGKKLVEYVKSIQPPGVDVEVDVKYGSPATVTNRHSPYVAAAKRALSTVFGREPVFVREGGSIPVIGAFKDLLGLDALLVGFGLSDDRIHSPNEKFDLVNFQSAMRFSVQFWPELANAAA